MSVSLPAGCFMGEERSRSLCGTLMPPLTWPAATSRPNLVSADMMTKTTRERAAFIDCQAFPFLFPSFTLSPPITEEHNKKKKHTRSNLKLSPRVKLDWKPLLKEITFGAEFLFLQSASGAKEVREALWRCPLLRLPV